MDDIGQYADLGSTALPLLAVLAGIIMMKKLLRLGLFLALLGGAVLVMEYQGFPVIDYSVALFHELHIGEFFHWIVAGDTR